MKGSVLLLAVGIIAAGAVTFGLALDHDYRREYDAAVKNYRPADCLHGGHLMADPDSAEPKEGDVIEPRCMRTPEGEWQVFGKVKK